MLSKSRIKFIRSLRLNKFRSREGLFVIEGDKLVKEALTPSANQDFKIDSIYGLQDWFDENEKLIGSNSDIFDLIKPAELKLISNLTTPNRVLALVHLNKNKLKFDNSADQLHIGLDDVQDPGNLGTIIRLADWFGIRDILLTKGCADPYSPKVVQASMGSIFRTNLHEVELEQLLKGLPRNYPVYGAVLDGENIYQSELSGKGIIIFGNESKGISRDILYHITHALTIPKGKSLGSGAESLNVSVALGIILSEFIRRSI